MTGCDIFVSFLVSVCFLVVVYKFLFCFGLGCFVYVYWMMCMFTLLSVRSSLWVGLGGLGKLGVCVGYLRMRGISAYLI